MAHVRGDEVAVLGLGQMGFAMAKNLAHAGYRVRVWNRTPEKARERAKEILGARVYGSPRAAADGVEFVLTSLSNDDAVRQTLAGDDGLLRGLARGAVHLETSTISVGLSRELVGLHADAGAVFLAAHVFGRPEAAEARKLWVAAGGPPLEIDRALPLLAAISQRVFRFDAAPQATLMKVCGNLMIASVIEVLGEVLALGEKGGIHPDDAMKVLNAVFGDSPVIANYGARIAAGVFQPAGFKLPLGLKDVSLALHSGEEFRVPLPVASLVRDHLVAALAKGGDELDWAALTTVVRDEAGLPAARA